MSTYIILSGALILIAYLWHINRGLSGVPEDARRLAGKPYTKEFVQETYRRMEREPIDFAKYLPPKTGRRYIVTGGTGFLGKWTVFHLLQRGESPEAIKILDIRPPSSWHTDFRGLQKSKALEVAATSVGFEACDVTDAQSTRRAFEAAWPEHVRDAPLTVLHCAALIRHWESADYFYPRQARVNVDGTRHVVDAAKAVGASILIATSSSSVLVKRPHLWTLPWQRYGEGYVQVVSDRMKDAPVATGRREDFFSNYPYSKAMAERIVLPADEKGVPGGMRTGVIRPGNGIYGGGGDYTLGTYLNHNGGPTWIPHVVQNFISASNAVYAHLLFEQRLLEAPKFPQRPDLGGRAFLVTDPNPSVTFEDLYVTLEVCARSSPRFTRIPPLPAWLVAHVIEAYSRLQHHLRFMLPALPTPLNMVTPPLFATSAHTLLDDSLARASPEEGGLGYRAPITTAEGFCTQVLEFNRALEQTGTEAMQGEVHSVKEAVEMAAVPALKKL